MNIFQYFRDLITALNNIGITLKAIAIDIAEIRKINSQILLKFGPRWPGLFSLRFISQLEGDGMASKFLVDAPLPELPEGNPDKVTFRNVKLTVNGVESVHKLFYQMRNLHRSSQSPRVTL